MIIRTPIKDALRASIEDEDAALRKRKPSREKMRRSSVKATARSFQRLSASSRKRGPEAGKPLEVTTVKLEGPRAGDRGELVTPGVGMYEAQLPADPADVVVARWVRVEPALGRLTSPWSTR